MVRTNKLVIALAIVATACTNTSVDATTTSTSTTPPTPLTTLTPQSTISTSTTLPPTTTSTLALPTNDCEVGQRTAVEEYTQGCDVLGIEILAGEEVDPAAVDQMADRIFNMLVARPDLLRALTDAGVSSRVIGKDQRLPSLPEFEDVYDLYPGIDWNRATRSFPGTDLIPFVAGAEENLLCLDGDRFEGEDPFLRDMALAIRRFGMFSVDPITTGSIERAYSTSIAQGLWVNTIAEINSDEYWAEGVQSYFDMNLEEPEDRPPNSAHNHVDTREELKVYDLSLYEIARSVFGDTPWRPSCP